MAAEGQEDMLDFNAQKMDDQMGELLEYAGTSPYPFPTSQYIPILTKHDNQRLRKPPSDAAPGRPSHPFLSI